MASRAPSRKIRTLVPHIVALAAISAATPAVAATCEVYGSLGVLCTLGSYVSEGSYTGFTPVQATAAESAAQVSNVFNIQNRVIAAAVNRGGLQGGESGALSISRGGGAWHNGLKIDDPGNTGSSRSTEISTSAGAYINATKELQLGVLGGYTQVHTKSSDGKSTAETADFSGYALYTRNETYFMALVSGSTGQSRERQGLDVATFDLSSFSTSGAVGHVFELGQSGLKDSSESALSLDIRLGVLYEETRAAAVETQTLGTISATLSREYTLPSGATFEPYVKGEYRYQFDHNETLGNAVFSQDDSIGVAGIGFEYKRNALTIEGEAYCEFASDRTTVAGTIGAKLKLDDPHTSLK
jgi:outer membrane autotransporter protein